MINANMFTDFMIEKQLNNRYETLPTVINLLIKSSQQLLGYVDM